MKELKELIEELTKELINDMNEDGSTYDEALYFISSRYDYLIEETVLKAITKHYESITKGDEK